MRRWAVCEDRKGHVSICFSVVARITSSLCIRHSCRWFSSALIMLASSPQCVLFRCFSPQSSSDTAPAIILTKVLLVYAFCLMLQFGLLALLPSILLPFSWGHHAHNAVDGPASLLLLRSVERDFPTLLLHSFCSKHWSWFGKFVQIVETGSVLLLLPRTPHSAPHFNTA